MCETMKNFGHLGTGIYFYFFYLKFLILTFILAGAMISVPAIIISRNYNNQMNSYCNANVTKTNYTICDEYNNRDNDWLYSMNCDNLKYYTRYLDKINDGALSSNVVDYSFIIFLSLIVLLVVKHLFTVIVDAADLEIDILNITPADYTLMITNIPQTIEHKDIIIEEYLSIANPNATNAFDNDIKPVEVNMAFKVSEFIKTKEAYLKLKNTIKRCELKKLSNYKVLCRKNMSLELLKSQLAETTIKLNEYIVDLDNPQKNLFTGVAFATFNTSKDCDLFLSEFPNTYLKYFFVLFQYLMATSICCCCCDKKKINILKNKLFLRVSQAPEPTDILWENLEVTWTERVVRALVSYAITFLILVCSFGIILGLNLYQTGQNKSLYKYGISALISIIVSIINFIVITLINILTDTERKISVSTKYLSNSVKLQVVSI
jgi:hypothetical protein